MNGTSQKSRPKSSPRRPKTSPVVPPTPESATPHHSLRRISSISEPKSPQTSIPSVAKSLATNRLETPRSTRKSRRSLLCSEKTPSKASESSDLAPEMNGTPQKSRPKSSPRRPKTSPVVPPTPESATPRHSLRRISSISEPKSPQTPIPSVAKSLATNRLETPRSTRKSRRSLLCSEKTPSKAPTFSPATPNPPESKKRKRSEPGESRPRASRTPKRRVYYKKVVYDGGEFEVGDDVYVKRREGVESDDEDPEVEACWICFQFDGSVMIECDDCLGGFHVKCLKPRLKKISEGEWICWFCEMQKMGKEVKLPKPPQGKKLTRTAKEKLLSSDLWAARIER